MTEWSKDLVLYRMTRADETLEDARILAKAGRWNACVNRLYYACFYAVSALLVRDGLSSSKHAGVRSLFNQAVCEDRQDPEGFGHGSTMIFLRDVKRVTTSTLSAFKNRRFCHGSQRQKNSLGMSPVSFKNK